MDFLKKAAVKGPQLEIEEGQEWLHRVYEPKASDHEVDVFVAIDGGSTKTTGRIFDVSTLVDDFDAQFAQKFTIPSVSSIVPHSNEIDAKGPELIENLESSIINLDDRPDAIFRNARLLRGPKFFNSELKENKLGSSGQKTTDPTYYYNLYDFLGYGALVKFESAVPRKIRVRLSASLPPDDTSKFNLRRFRDNLKPFTWKHMATGISIQFEFVGLSTMTEPEAAIKGFINNQDMDTPRNVLHIEGGGRSIGAELLVNGRSMDKGQKTFLYGGSHLARDIRDLYLDNRGGQPLPLRIVERALVTGKVTDRGDVVDIINEIKVCKDQHAAKIFADVKQEVFDEQSRVSVGELDMITVGGRYFNSGEYGYSVAEPLERMYKEVAPKVQFVRISDNMIPEGLVWNGLIEFFPELVDDSAPEQAQQEGSPIVHELAEGAAQAAVAAEVSGTGSSESGQ